MESVDVHAYGDGRFLINLNVVEVGDRWNGTSFETAPSGRTTARGRTIHPA